MAKNLSCGFTVETVFKYQVCDLQRKNGAEKEIKRVNRALLHSPLSANNCFVGTNPHLMAVIKMITFLSLPCRYDMPGTDVIY